MTDSDNSALVPNPPGTLEKAKPGERRILSGMVADTLALARKERVEKPGLNVLLGFGSKERFEFFVQSVAAKLGAHYELRFVYFEKEDELLQVSQSQPFDLAFVFCGYTIIKWDTRAEDSIKAVELMERVAVQSRKAVITPSWFDAELTARLTLAGVRTFQGHRFSTDVFWNSVQDCLRVPLSSKNGFVTSPPNRVRRPRIVVLDDEPFVLDAIKMMLQFDFSDASILTFTNPRKALEELAREDPDAFLTNYAMPIMKGDEVLRILAARNVKYPVAVLSAYAQADLVLLWGCHDLDVVFIPKPFLLEDLRWFFKRSRPPVQ